MRHPTLVTVFAVAAYAACACPPKATNGPASGSGSSSAAVLAPAPATCADVKPHVAELYRADAQDKEPARVEAAVADNVAMVMKECNLDMAKRVPCLMKATSTTQLEKDCLAPLDEEGTEGEGAR